MAGTPDETDRRAEQSAQTACETYASTHPDPGPVSPDEALIAAFNTWLATRATATSDTATEAQAAYAAYAETVGGYSVTGAPLPGWDGLGDRVRSGWTAAAAAARGN